MRALCLSGGGSLGSWEVGAYKYLSEIGLQYDIVCGVSVGAVNASHIAQFHKAYEQEAATSLVQLWSNLKDSDIKKHWFIPYISAFWTGGIYNNQPLRDFLNKNLNVNNVKHSNRKLVIGAVCLNNGEYERFDENSDLIKAIMGSSALPLGFPPEVINGKQYLDGGLKTSDPINDAIDLGADIIDVVICCPEKTNKYSNSNNILTVGLRGFDIMNNEISEADLKIAELYNKLVLSGAKTDKRVVEINVIRPKEDLVGGGLDFIHSNIMTIMEQGYNQAKEVFQK